MKWNQLHENQGEFHSRGCVMVDGRKEHIMLKEAVGGGEATRME
jgi:hypothetical protein